MLFFKFSFSISGETQDKTSTGSNFYEKLSQTSKFFTQDKTSAETDSVSHTDDTMASSASTKSILFESSQKTTYFDSTLERSTGRSTAFPFVDTTDENSTTAYSIRTQEKTQNETTPAAGQTSDSFILI